MKRNSHKQYKNPTIIEAIIEVRFAKKIEKNDHQNLEKVLGSKYTCKKDELVTYTAQFNPSELALQHDKSGEIRLKFTLKDQIFVQVYPDRLSYHWVGKYPGWDTFQSEFHRFSKHLNNALPEIKGQQVGVRFINKLDQKKTKQKVGFWLKSSPNYSKCILVTHSGYFYRCRWSLKSDRWAQVCIAEAELTKEDYKPLIFDIDVIQHIPKFLKIESSLIDLASDLHDEIYKIFNSSISSNYKRVLNRKQELA